MRALPALPPDRQPVIIAARRSAIGRAGGMFREVEVEDLAAPVMRAVVEDAGVSVDEIDDVVLGNAAGPGGNIARLSALKAWGDVSIPGVTTDRQCGAGLEAVIHACRMVQAGAGEVYVAGGVESHSRKPTRALPGGAPYDRARFSPDDIGDPEMGLAAENVAWHYNVSRERQDAFALQSHARAKAAQVSGAFVSRDHPHQRPSARRMPPRRPHTRTSRAPPPGLCQRRYRHRGQQLPLERWRSGAGGDVGRTGRAPTATKQHSLSKTLPLQASIQTSSASAPWPRPKNSCNAAPICRSTSSRTLSSTKPLPRRFWRASTNWACPLTCPTHKAVPSPLVTHFGASGAILVTRLFSQLIRTPAPDTALAMAMIGIGGGMGLTAAFRPVTL